MCNLYLSHGKYRINQPFPAKGLKMKKLYFLLIVAYCILAALAQVSWATSGADVDLKLRLEKGKTYNLRTVNDTKMTLSLMGQEMKINQKMGYDITYEVQAVDDQGNAAIKAAFHSINMELEIGEVSGKIEYNSVSPAEAETPAANGPSCRMVLSKTGKVREVEGMKEVKTRMMEVLESSGEQETIKEMMRMRFEEMFSDQKIVQMMGGVFGMFPDQPVGVGDSWSTTGITLKDMLKTEMRFSGGAGDLDIKDMPIAEEHNWTLKERRDGVAVLAVVSVAKPKPEAGATEMEQSKPTLDLAGEQSGKLELEESTGWIVSGRMVYRFLGEQKIEDSPMGSIVIPLKAEVTTIYGPF